MNQARNEIIASIARAKLELDGALEDFKALPMVDPMTFGFINHALNNYLHVTRGTIGLLVEELKDHPSADVGTWLKGLLEVTDRMGNLAQEMQSGQRKVAPELNMQKIDLTLLVRRACDFYRRPATRKKLEVHFEKTTPVPPKVRADRMAVAAILDNLLSNAVKFSPAGKRITVDVREEGKSVTCRVCDEGPGIHPKDRMGLFHRGFRSRAEGVGGTSSGGFGLAVAAELVANLGGEIGCESEWGQGACFFFRLPCVRGRTRLKLPK